MADSTRYRFVDFIGGRILQAREMNTLQSMTEGVDSGGNSVVRDLNALYREGASLNINPVITAGTTTVTLQPKDNTKPMQVFVRGRWESLQNAEAPSITLSPSQPVLYLNWLLNLVTSSDDPSLVDASTGQAAANMGQLALSVSSTDTSAVALPGTALQKNTATIVLFQFTSNPPTLTLSPIDNVNAPALADNQHAGLVKLTTGTASGLAVANDDPRLSNGRAPSPGTVVDASVRSPLSNGNTNSDGTIQYDLTSDPGGISATKIIWQAYKQSIADYLGTVRASIASVLSTLSSHIGAPLGNGTHPMPTAAQVGAVPLSHINMPLNLPGSHPATVNSDSGGFTLNQSTGFGGVQGATPDLSQYAFGLVENGVAKSGLLHNGDVVTQLLASMVATPGGTPLNFQGQLTGLKSVAQVLVDHVNQNSHSNPHGLSLSDLSAPSVQNVVTGSRSLNTPFVNSSGRSMIVTVTLTCPGNAAGTATFLCGPTTNSMQSVVSHSAISFSSGSTNTFVTKLVPPGYAYQVSRDVSLNLMIWVEDVLPV